MHSHLCMTYNIFLQCCATYTAAISSIATGGHLPSLPRPCCVMGFAQIQSFFGGEVRGDEGRIQATNLRRKAFDSCKLYISGFWWGEFCPQTTGSLPMDPTGDFRSPEDPDPMCPPCLQSLAMPLSRTV